MERIATTTLTSSQASITFSGFPIAYQSGYKHLVIRLSSRTDAGSNTWINIALNGLTSGFTTRGVESNSSNTYVRSDRPAMVSHGLPSSSGNTFSNSEIVIMGYDEQAYFGRVNILSRSAANDFFNANSTYWEAPDAVSNLSLYPASGNFVAGTTATIYGLK